MSRKILIIEDEVTMRRNVALMLELEGHTPLSPTRASKASKWPVAAGLISFSVT